MSRSPSLQDKIAFVANDPLEGIANVVANRSLAKIASCCSFHGAAMRADSSYNA